MKKGISLLALIVTIIVTVIILSTVVISYDSIVSSTKKSEFAKEIYTVKKLVTDYEFMNAGYPVSDQVFVDLNSMSSDSKSQFSDEPSYLTNSVGLYKVDLAKAGVENIIRGTAKYGSNDIYAFSTSTKKLYYVKGEKIGDKTYYTLTDELYKLIGINDIK